MTAHSERPHYTPLFVAPLNLGRSFLSLINRETAHAKAGRPAFIFAKFNSLLDQKIIEALYRASQAGVRIELLVRGVCALRPGVRGLSSRIRVRRVIGRFLEHSRIFVFGHGGRTEVYLGSADWMQPNIYERVEVIFQLKDRALCSQIFAEVVAPYLADTEKTRVLMPTGEYVRRHALRSLGRADNNRNPFNAQELLIDFAESRQALMVFHLCPHSCEWVHRRPPRHRPIDCAAHFDSKKDRALPLYNRLRWKDGWNAPSTGCSGRRSPMSAIPDIFGPAGSSCGLWG